MGAWSNLALADRRVRGPIVKLGTDLSEIDLNDMQIHGGATAPDPRGFA